MAVPFSNTKLRPPQGFRNILEGLSREVLRCQPGDIFAFGTLYFDKLIKIREDTGVDPALAGAELEDRFYNKVFKNICGELDEMDKAAIKIQTKYRQYKARTTVTALRQDRAATRIQAGFHGFLARKRVRRMRQEMNMDMDYERCQAMTDDEFELLKEGDVPAILASVDIEDDLNRVDSELDFQDPAVQEAALKIQAGIMGLKIRQQWHEALADDFDVPNEGDEDFDAPDDDEEEGEGGLPRPPPITGSKHSAAAGSAAALTASKHSTSAPGAASSKHSSVAPPVVGSKHSTAGGSGAPGDQLPTAGSSNIDFSDPEVQEAALKIQAGIKGFIVRRDLQHDKGSQHGGAGQRQDTGERHLEEDEQEEQEEQMHPAAESDAEREQEISHDENPENPPPESGDEEAK